MLLYCKVDRVQEAASGDADAVVTVETLTACIQDSVHLAEHLDGSAEGNTAATTENEPRVAYNKG